MSGLCLIPSVAALLFFIFMRESPLFAQQSSNSGAIVRPCKPTEEEAKAQKKPLKRSKKARQAAEDPASACLELHASSLDVQEFLQAFVRKQNWRVGDEEIGESFWSFSMALNDEALLGYANGDSLTERVQWRGGKGVVLVKAAELSDGFTRATVSARFKGFGESEDAFAVKRASWPLASNGKLEAFLVAALETHFHPKH
jgi:hypothetical protein